METDSQRMAALMLSVLDVAVVVDVIDVDGGVRAVLELEGRPSCPDCGSNAVTTGSVEVERPGSPVYGRPLVKVWRLRSLVCERCRRAWSEEIPALKE